MGRIVIQLQLQFDLQISLELGGLVMWDKLPSEVIVSEAGLVFGV